MSEFDKEAEREKLRRKYEAEQEDRQATQRMSELLLQGATMTNRHCDTCGSPIFRYEGQEFCPSCQAASNDGEAATQQPGPEDESPDLSETAPGSEAEARRFADEERAEPTDTASQPSEVRERGDAAGAETESEPDPSSAAGTATPTDEPTQTPSADASDDLAGARDALAASITRLSRKAAAAEDPRRAREFLEAAREAATVLETLDGR
jgi:UPF0148 protein